MRPGLFNNKKPQLTETSLKMIANSFAEVSEKWPHAVPQIMKQLSQYEDHFAKVRAELKTQQPEADQSKSFGNS